MNGIHGVVILYFAVGKPHGKVGIGVERLALIHLHNSSYEESLPFLQLLVEGFH